MALARRECDEPLLDIKMMECSAMYVFTFMYTISYVIKQMENSSPDGKKDSLSFSFARFIFKLFLFFSSAKNDCAALSFGFMFTVSMGLGDTHTGNPCK